MTSADLTTRPEQRSEKWWERFDDPARELVRRLFRLGAVDHVRITRPATPYEDRREATDAVVDIPSQQIRVAFRMRQVGRTNYRDFTLRAVVPSGAPTELDKLRDGTFDRHYYLYAWVDAHAAVPCIDQWWFIDLVRARDAGLFHSQRTVTWNNDRTGFVVIRRDELEAGGALRHTDRSLPVASVVGPLPYYADDYVTLYHGDCRRIDAWLSADVLVTDPPYGVSYISNSSRYGATDPIIGDADLAARDGVIEMWGDRPALVFGTWRAPRPQGVRQLVVWDKGDDPGMGDLTMPWGPSHEELYVMGSGFAGKRRSNVLRYPKPPLSSEARAHPTPKPIPLMRDLLGYCPPGVIADPFAGSGSTLRAAKDLGRRAIGVEIEERYCELAARRLSQGALDLWDGML